MAKASDVTNIEDICIVVACISLAMNKIGTNITTYHSKLGWMYVRFNSVERGVNETITIARIGFEEEYTFTLHNTAEMSESEYLAWRVKRELIKMYIEEVGVICVADNEDVKGNVRCLCSLIKSRDKEIKELKDTINAMAELI